MCFTNILLQIFCSYGAWLKFKKSTNILLLWSMVGIRKTYKHFATNILLLWSMVGIRKSMPTNILLLWSMVGIRKSMSTNILLLRCTIGIRKSTNILLLWSMIGIRKLVEQISINILLLRSLVFFIFFQLSWIVSALHSSVGA